MTQEGKGANVERRMQRQRRWSTKTHLAKEDVKQWPMDLTATTLTTWWLASISSGEAVPGDVGGR